MSIETVFLDTNEHGDFLIYYMRAASFERAQQVANASVAAIDLYHQQFKRDTWEQGTKLELLLDLQPLQK